MRDKRTPKDVCGEATAEPDKRNFKTVPALNKRHQKGNCRERDIPEISKITPTHEV